MRKWEVEVYYYPLNFCSPAWHYNASVQLLNAPNSTFRCFVGISIEPKENHPKINNTIASYGYAKHIKLPPTKL